MLDDLPMLHCEGEILHDYVPFPYCHVLGRSIWCGGSGGLGYGCKILSYQVRDVQTQLESPEDFIRDLQNDAGFHILHLRRTNLLRHALSNIRARREQYHKEKGGAALETRALHVDPAHVLEWIRSSEVIAKYEQELLAGVPHLS